jgi:AcrR family transcriptional regulator
MLEDTERQYHHGRLRIALLDAARTILDHEGVDHLTIRAVARLAGVSHAAPANHFSDRRALLTALAMRDFYDLSWRVTQAVHASEDGTVDRLHKIAEAFLNYALAFPHRFRLLWRGDLVNMRDPDLETAMNGLYSKLLTATTNDRTSKSRAIAFWSMLHGYAALRIDAMFTPQPDERTGEPRLTAMINLLFAEE